MTESTDLHTMRILLDFTNSLELEAAKMVADKINANGGIVHWHERVLVPASQAYNKDREVDVSMGQAVFQWNNDLVDVHTVHARLRR